MPVSILYQLPGTTPMDFWQGLTTVLEKYGIETLAMLVALYLILRAVPGVIKSIIDVLQTRAKATAAEQVGQVQNDAKTLDILQQMVTHTATNNTILLGWQAEFAQWRETVSKGTQTNERLEIAINQFNNETAALRKDVKNWPHTVDGTLAGAITAIETLRLSNEKEHSDVIKVLEAMQALQIDIHTWVGVMYKLVMRPTPPPPLPNDQKPSAPAEMLHADAGAKAPESEEAA